MAEAVDEGAGSEPEPGFDPDATQAVPMPDSDGVDGGGDGSSGDGPGGDGDDPDGTGPSRRVIAAVIGGLLALIIGAVLVVSSGDSEPAPTTTTIPPTTTTVAGPPAPLTGLPLGDEEVLNRPALVLKIDNDQRARPHAGIDRADVVFEEQVEGGVTRLAAVFHSRDADRVGPIRSGRTTDIFLVSNLGRPLFGFSGANPMTLAEIRRADIHDVRWDARPSEYRRDSSRPAPHNLFTSTVGLYGSTPDATGPPPMLWGFVPDGQEFAGDPATEVNVGFGGKAGYRALWQFDSETGTYQRDENGTPHLVESGEQISATNVVVQIVDYLSRFGNPEAQLVGEGDLWVFSGGRVTQGRWSRAGAADPTVFTDLGGRPIRLAPGNTWVELPATGRPPAFS